jgi:TolA-binding protein
MKNFVLGFLIAISGSSLAYEWSKDGSLTMTSDEVKETEIMFYQLRQNFDIAVDRVNELQKQLDKLQKEKCT